MARTNPLDSVNAQELPDVDVGRERTDTDVFARWQELPVRFVVGGATQPASTSVHRQGSGTRARVWNDDESLDDDLDDEPAEVAPLAAENLLAGLRPAVVLPGEGREPRRAVDHADPPLLMVLHHRDDASEVGRTVSLGASVNQLSIGRTPDNQMVLNDASVSRRHALLTRCEEGWWLADLGSTNGTFVNGSRVKDALLRDGDRVRVGGVIVQSLLDGPRAPRVADIRSAIRFTDVLTQLWTEQGLVTQYEERRPYERGARGGVAIFDVEGLGVINKTYGDLMGDEVIVTFAQRLRDLPASVGTCARLRGGEFAVWFEGCEAHELAALTERVRQSLHREGMLLHDIPIHPRVRAAAEALDHATSDLHDVLRRLRVELRRQRDAAR